MKHIINSILISSLIVFAIGTAFSKGGSVNQAAKPKNANVYKIHVKINGLKDTNLLLGHHFGSKKYVVDTVKLNSKGEGTFVGDSLLDGGIYLIITPSMNYFEILIDKDQDFSLSTDTIDLVKNLKIEGSEENTQFYDYQSFMVDNQKKAVHTRKQYDKAKKMVDSVGLSASVKQMYQDSLTKAKTELGVLDSLVKQKWNSIISSNLQSLLSTILKMMKEIEVPQSPKDANGRILDSTFQYNYYKKHFFDNVNFADYRILRTPILEGKIDEYFDKVCYQIPDTLCKEVDRVVNLSKANDKVFRYVVQYIFNKYNNPKIMGMDRLFVYISQKYYLSGQATWAQSDTAFMKSVRERVSHLKYNLLGEIAPELRLFDLNGNVVSLHSIQADYIVLYFFDTECGHCQKIIPEWKKINDEKGFSSKNIVTLFVETQADKKKMQDFTEKHGLKDYKMAYDPYQTTNFRVLYDIYSTPTPYILDKDKKIIAKRIDPETIADFLTKMLERDQMLKNKTKK